MTLWRITMGEARRRPGRMALTFASVVIGVGSVVAIVLAVDATRRAHHEMFEAAAGRAALEIVAEGLGGFDESVAAIVSDEPDVVAAVPAVQMPAAVVGPAGTVPTLVLGIDPSRDTAARDYSLRTGTMLGPSDGVLVEYRFAERLGLELGQPVRLVSLQGIVELPVVGLLEPLSAARFNGGAVAIMPLATAQRLFRMDGRVNTIQLVLKPTTNLNRLRDRVRERLPTGLTVQAPAARAALARDSLLSLEHGLSTLSVSSVVAGAFVILNACLMNLGERRRQFAMLRAIGATRNQVVRLILHEAALLGVSGTIAGLAVGWGLAIGLRVVMQQLLGGVTMSELRWTAGSLALPLATGPIMAFGATLVPARRASSRVPLSDLLIRGQDGADDVRHWPAVLGILMILSTFTVLVGLLLDWFPSSISLALLPLAMGAFLIGCTLVLPLMLSPLMRLVSWVMRPMLGIAGYLALRQLNRHRSRTALTVGVLLVALVFTIGFGNSLQNNMRDIHDWLGRVATADFFIRAVWPDPTTMVTATPISASLSDAIALIDGVERVDKLHWISTRVSDRSILVVAFSCDSDRPLPLDLATGESREAAERFARGEILLGTPLARELDLGVGDHISVETRGGTESLLIAGTATEYTVGGMVIFMEWDTAKRLFEFDGVHNLAVTARRGSLPAVATQLQALAREHGLLVQCNVELRDMFDRQTKGFLGSVWILLSLVFVVASLGIVNTLTMNSLEQTREIGVLRAIGMQRRQVRNMVLAQALAMGLISLLPGVVAGAILAAMMNVATYPLVGQPIEFYISTWFIVGCCVVALSIASLAGFVPARRTARLEIIRAIQFE